MTRSAAAASRSLVGDVVSSIADARALADEWDALAAGGARSPFGLPATVLPWWSALGKGELRIATARSGSGELVGVAPFHARRVGGLELVRPLGHGAGAIGSTLVAPVKGDVAGVLLGGLLAGSLAAVHLTDVGLDDALVVAARRGEGAGDPDRPVALRATLHDTCPRIDLDGLASSADLLARPSHRNLRKTLARIDRSLADSGAVVRVAEATGPADVAAAFDRLGPLLDAAEAANPRAHFGRDALGDFFRGALDAWAQREQVTLLTLLVDDEPAAFDVYVTRGDLAWAVLGRYEPRFADLSPGHLLLRGAVDWAIERGITVLDLQLGADLYKTRWATGEADTFEVLIGPPTLLGAAAGVVRAVEGAYRLRTRALERVAR